MSGGVDQAGPAASRVDVIPVTTIFGASQPASPRVSLFPPLWAGSRLVSCPVEAGLIDAWGGVLDGVVGTGGIGASAGVRLVEYS